MKRIIGKERVRAYNYLMDAATIATYSICLRAKCGALIVNKINRKVLGRDCNSPPGDKKLEKCLKDDLPSDFKSDKTCCIHAEQRAILRAIDVYGLESLKGATMYFMRLDLEDEIIFAEKPYCTICSKAALDVGIEKWVLWHKNGIYEYDSNEYNDISFGRKEWELK